MNRSLALLRALPSSGSSSPDAMPNPPLPGQRARPACPKPPKDKRPSRRAKRRPSRVRRARLRSPRSSTRICPMGSLSTSCRLTRCPSCRFACS